LTVFLTHDSPVNQQLADDPMVRLGVHPNFNPLLNGDAGPGTDARAVLLDARKLRPDARCVRSHSLVQSSRLLDLCAELGFTHECNTLIPLDAGIALKPWLHWTGGMVRVPYRFDDSLAGHSPAGFDAARASEAAALNWMDPEMPPGVRAARQDPDRFVRFVRQAVLPGSASFLAELARLHRDAGGDFGFIEQIEAPA